MSMTTYVVGYKPADSKWNKFKKLWDQCVEAGVTPPQEVIDYFDDEYPGDKPGMEVDVSKAAEEYFTDDVSGYEVNIDKLPKDVKIIRFIISY